jgi:hypothetical protein
LAPLLWGWWGSGYSVAAVQTKNSNSSSQSKSSGMMTMSPRGFALNVGWKILVRRNIVEIAVSASVEEIIEKKL